MPSSICSVYLFRTFYLHFLSPPYQEQGLTICVAHYSSQWNMKSRYDPDSAAPVRYQIYGDDQKLEIKSDRDFGINPLNIEKPNICKLHLTLLQSTVVSNPREKFLFRYWNQNLHLSVWPSWKLSKTSILKYSVNILGKYWYHCKHIELFKPIGQAGALRYNENTH